jgi:hypothetical protein
MRGQYDIQQSKNRSCLSSSAEENTRYTRYAAGHEGNSVEIEVRVRDASRRKVPRRELSSRTANVLHSRDDAIARKEEVCLLPGPAQSRACCAFCESLSWLPLTTSDQRLEDRQSRCQFTISGCCSSTSHFLPDGLDKT